MINHTRGADLSGVGQLVELGGRRAVRLPLPGVVVAEAPQPPQWRFHLPPVPLGLIDLCFPTGAYAMLCWLLSFLFLGLIDLCFLPNTMNDEEGYVYLSCLSPDFVSFGGLQLCIMEH
jgi:hypothetical protein